MECDPLQERIIVGPCNLLSNVKSLVFKFAKLEYMVEINVIERTEIFVEGNMACRIYVHKTNVQILINNFIQEFIDVLTYMEELLKSWKNGLDKNWAVVISSKIKIIENSKDNSCLEVNSPTHGRSVS